MQKAFVTSLWNENLFAMTAYPSLSSITNLHYLSPTNT